MHKKSGKTESGSSPSRGTWIEIALHQQLHQFSKVVPLAGDVDRNLKCWSLHPSTKVVPLAGDVDRNTAAILFVHRHIMSSPSRGTWIEINRKRHARRSDRVVPLAGDVDRNLPIQAQPDKKSVVPLAGDVDRNTLTRRQIRSVKSRPPRGGRG